MHTGKVREPRKHSWRWNRVAQSSIPLIEGYLRLLPVQWITLYRLNLPYLDIIATNANFIVIENLSPTILRIKKKSVLQICSYHQNKHFFKRDKKSWENWAHKTCCTNVAASKWHAPWGKDKVLSEVLRFSSFSIKTCYLLWSKNKLRLIQDLEQYLYYKIDPLSNTLVSKWKVMECERIKNW